MVSSVPLDILAAPELAIQELFDKHTQSQSSDEFSNVLSNHFKDIFSKEERLTLIPHLDASYLAHNERNDSQSSSLKLIQFHGMVQDTSASPELYLSRLHNGKYGGWGAHQVTDGPVDYSNLRECTRYWVVSIPGVSAWAENSLSKDALTLSSARQNSYKFPLPSTPHIGVQVNLYASDADLKSTDIVTFVGLFEPENETLHVLFHFHQNTVQKAYGIYPLEMIDEDTKIQTLHSELISWIADEALAGDEDAAKWVLLSAISRVQSRNPPIIPASLTLSRFPPPPGSASSITGNALPPSKNIPVLYHILSLLVPIITHIPLSLSLLNDGAFVPESKLRPQSTDADEDPEDELHSGLLQLAPSSICLITDSGITEGQINDRGVRNLRALQEVIRNQTLEYVFPYSGFRFETDIGCIVCTEGQKSALVETHVTVPLEPASSFSPSELQQRLYKSSAEINLPPAGKLKAWRKLIGGAMMKQTSNSAEPSSSRVPVGGIGVSDEAANVIQEEFVKERQDTVKEKNESKHLGESDDARKGKNVTTPDDLIHRMLMAKLLALSMHEPEVSTSVWEEMKALDRRRLGRTSR